MTRLHIASFAAATAAVLLATSIAQAQNSQSRRQQSWSNQPAQGSTNSRAAYPHIIMGGRDMGTDPDPNIRANLLRDTGMAFGGER
jgi:hypothetical protein